TSATSTSTKVKAARPDLLERMLWRLNRKGKVGLYSRTARFQVRTRNPAQATEFPGLSSFSPDSGVSAARCSELAKSRRQIPPALASITFFATLSGKLENVHPRQ